MQRSSDISQLNKNYFIINVGYMFISVHYEKVLIRGLPQHIVTCGIYGGRKLLTTRLSFGSDTLAHDCGSFQGVLDLPGPL